MTNKQYRYIITWGWREEGNRIIEDFWKGTATSVPRAISKMIRELNDGKTGEDELKAAHVFVLDVRTVSFDRAVQEYGETTAS